MPHAVAIKINRANQRLREVIGQRHPTQRREHADVGKHGFTMQHHHHQADITQARGQVSQCEQAAPEIKAIGLITGHMRYRQQTTEYSQTNTNRYTKQRQLAKKWQVRTGIFHDPRADKPHAEQEHTDQDNRETSVTGNLLWKFAGAQFHALEVAAFCKYPFFVAFFFRLRSKTLGAFSFFLGRFLRDSFFRFFLGLFIGSLVGNFGGNFGGAQIRSDNHRRGVWYGVRRASRRHNRCHRRIRLRRREVLNSTTNGHGNGHKQIRGHAKPHAAFCHRIVILGRQHSQNQHHRAKCRQGRTRLFGPVGQQPKYDGGN